MKIGLRLAFILSISSTAVLWTAQARAGFDDPVCDNVCNPLTALVSCAQSGLASCSFANQGSMSAATDGGLLSSSGLDQLAAQQLAQSNLSGVNPSSPDTQGMLGKALGDTSSDVATGLLKIEALAEQNAKKLEGTTAFSKGAATADDSPAGSGGLGSFHFDAQATSTAKAEIGFQRTPSSTGDGDIWHADYKGSIFQIVSSKIEESKDRVLPMQWTTPLNRALLGLPQLKGAGK